MPHVGSFATLVLGIKVIGIFRTVESRNGGVQRIYARPLHQGGQGRVIEIVRRHTELLLLLLLYNGIRIWREGRMSNCGFFPKRTRKKGKLKESMSQQEAKGSLQGQDIVATKNI